MSARIKITSPCTKDINRSDSPGYFTLSSNSDSDIGDGSGDIYGEDEDFLQPKQHDTTLSQSRNDDNFADSSSFSIYLKHCKLYLDCDLMKHKFTWNGLTFIRTIVPKIIFKYKYSNHGIIVG